MLCSKSNYSVQGEKIKDDEGAIEEIESRLSMVGCV